MTRFASAFFFKIIFLLSFVLSCYIVDAWFKCDNAWERFAMRYDTGNESHYETVALQANSWIFGTRQTYAERDMSAFGWPTGLGPTSLSAHRRPIGPKKLPRVCSSIARALSAPSRTVSLSHRCAVAAAAARPALLCMSLIIGHIALHVSICA